MIKNSVMISLRVLSFNRALNSLKHCSSCLDETLTKEIKHINTIDELQELISLLPKEYRGVRRIYEKILRLEEKSK